MTLEDYLPISINNIFDTEYSFWQRVEFKAFISSYEVIRRRGDSKDLNLWLTDQEMNFAIIGRIFLYLSFNTEELISKAVENKTPIIVRTRKPFPTQNYVNVQYLQKPEIPGALSILHNIGGELSYSREGLLSLVD
tara:strand:+ start:18995 stop:19402 length:408 start_codon:yes stop_codon:yes gene_type:complete